MKTRHEYRPHGVIPAVLLPFHEDFSIDERSYRAHLRDVSSVAGISAITTNAHSTEVASCTPEEQRRVLAITLDEIGDRLPVVNGIYADGGQQAARLARAAHDDGASALLVFPSAVTAMGQKPEMVIDHFRRIADATDLPLIAFQYSIAGGQGYPLSTLLRLAEEVPTVAAIKDWSGTPQLVDRQVRALHKLSRPVNVLSTHSAWLFASLVLGCDGLLSGSGSVVADLQVRLFRAVQANDLALARQLHDRITPTADVFYADPFVDMHNRMKEALVMLGKLPRAVVRPPLARIDDAERSRIRAALVAAGLLQD